MTEQTKNTLAHNDLLTVFPLRYGGGVMAMYSSYSNPDLATIFFDVLTGWDDGAHALSNLLIEVNYPHVTGETVAEVVEKLHKEWPNGSFDINRNGKSHHHDLMCAFVPRIKQILNNPNFTLSEMDWLLNGLKGEEPYFTEQVNKS